MATDLGEAAGQNLIADRYELGDLLGRGGMAEVRAGMDTRLQRPVAVKLMRTDLAAQPDMRVRFTEEARMAARLTHPHAVAVFDTGEDDGRPFLVMERLPGRSLADVIGPPLAVRPVVTWAIEVLGALQAAHDAGLVHRDVKPANILLTDGGTAKIGDFGIAKAAEAADLTLTGTLLGTPAYVAPERLDGSPATSRSDLYSLAVVVYEALAGRRPYDAPTPLALAREIDRGAAPPLRAVRADVPPEVSAVVEQAMAKDPAERFPDAAAMAEALLAALASEGAPSSPSPSTSSPIPDTVATPVHRTQVLPASGWRAGPTPRESLAPRRVRRRRSRLPLVTFAALVVLAVVSLLWLTGRDRDDAGGDAPSPSSSLPPALDDALDRLDEAVDG